MFIELVDALRCLEPHDETWLVAAVTRMDGRHIIDGVLGCPICHREYPIRQGIGHFAATRDGDPARLTPVRASTDADRITRAAALLGLTDAGGIVCLDAGWADCADALAELGPAHIVTFNADIDAGAETVSTLAVDDRLPFARGAVRALAIDADSTERGLLASATGCIRSRGRLVAPSTAPVPDGVVELARDETVWVGERAVVATPPVALRSARR
jgi:uncharacterized protein YbaR (Trm112 family)